MSADRDLATSALLPFFVLAFGISWGLLALFFIAPAALEAIFGPPSGHHPVFILAVYAPALSAFLLVWLKAGGAGLAAFLSRLFLWRMPLVLWAVLLLGLPAIFFAGAAVKGSAALPAFGSVGALLAAMGFMLVLGPVEEFGWRGIALPLLQRRLAPFWAGLIIGVIWGLWHLPAFFLSGTPQSGWGLLPFIVGSIAVSVILTPMFNASGGSLLIAALFHFQLNNPLWPDAQPWDTLFFIAAAAAATWVARGALFQSGTGVTTVIPEAGSGEEEKKTRAESL